MEKIHLSNMKKSIIIIVLVVLGIASGCSKKDLASNDSKNAPGGKSGSTARIVIKGDYPAANAGIEAGTILAVNGEKVEDFDSFLDITYGIKPDEGIAITTDKGEYSLTTVKSPDNPKKGFVGIMPVANEKEMKEGYGKFKGVFYWIKDLFRWLFY